MKTETFKKLLPYLPAALHLMPEFKNTTAEQYSDMFAVVQAAKTTEELFEKGIEYLVLKGALDMLVGLWKNDLLLKTLPKMQSVKELAPPPITVAKTTKKTKTDGN